MLKHCKYANCCCSVEDLTEGDSVNITEMAFDLKQSGIQICCDYQVQQFHGNLETTVICSPDYFLSPDH